VHLPSYDLFSSTEILTQLAMEKMLAGLSSRRYRAGLEPAGQVVEEGAVSTSKSAVSRRFVAATETAPAELMSRRLGDPDPGAVQGRRGAFGRAPWRGAAGHRHRRDKAPPRGGGGLDRDRHPGHRPDHRAA